MVFSRKKISEIAAFIEANPTLSHEDVGRLIGIHPKTVERIAEGRHWHQRNAENAARKASVAASPRGGGADPTPEQILEICAKIREHWPPERHAPWEFPLGTIRRLDSSTAAVRQFL